MYSHRNLYILKRCCAYSSPSSKCHYYTTDQPNTACSSLFFPCSSLLTLGRLCVTVGSGIQLGLTGLAAGLFAAVGAHSPYYRHNLNNAVLASYVLARFASPPDRHTHTAGFVLSFSL